MLEIDKLYPSYTREGHKVNMAKEKGPQGNTKLYSYLNPLDDKQFILGEKIVEEIASTKIFQRLKYIKFLGGIDYAIVRSPNNFRQRYTRFQHSLGVAYLSSLYACMADLDHNERKSLYVSALLHDVGHAPLSHSLEQVFSDKFGIDHHIATDKIIKGESALGKEIFDILRWYNVDIDEVLSIINREDSRFGQFFSGPINFDTIEGILRTYSYVKNSTSNLNPHVVVYAATARQNEAQRCIVDDFWKIKGFVYDKVIGSPFGVIADHICKRYMQNNISKFSELDYFIDEPMLFKKLPGLRNALTNTIHLYKSGREPDFPIPYVRRSFTIEDKADFFSNKDDARYKQGKTPCTLLPLQPRELHSEAINWSLFDDESL